MTQTQSNLLQMVRDRLDEQTESSWLDTELRRWINQGAREVARRTETLQTTSTIAMSSGVQQYTAPTDVIRIYRVEYLDTSSIVYPLEYRDFNTMDGVWWSSQLTASGRPMLWTAWGFPPTLKIILYPTPDTSATNIKVYYYKLPTVIAEDGSNPNTTLDIPNGWEDLLVDYVEYNALRKDRDPRWQEAKALFEQHVTEMYEMTRRWTDQAGMMDFDIGVPLHPYIWNENWDG